MLGGAVSTFVADWHPPYRRRPGSPPQTRVAQAGVLPYVPAIDGLRALAVAAVLVYHANIGILPGGFLGVEVFFVISGYLITSLLLADRAREGRVGLLGFWQRRARRLLPAVFVLIIAALVYSVVFLPGEVHSLRGDALAGFGYVSNWYLIFDQQSYFESLGRPSLLRHLWSLAVEEQFYLIWPVVFALVLDRLRRKYALAVILAAAFASAGLMAYLYNPDTDPSRIYYGTDTRATGLLIGAALAFAWQIGRLPERLPRLTRHLAEFTGVCALAGLVLISAIASEQSAFLYRGGFALVALLTALLVAACVHPNTRLLSGLLSHQPLTWIGTRSYSIYLWHWPVFMLTRPGLDVSFDGGELFALRLALTALLAEASYRLVETPVRTGIVGRAWQSIRSARWPNLGAALRPLSATSAATGGVIFLGITVAAATPPAPPSYLALPAVNIVSWSQPVSAASATRHENAVTPTQAAPAYLLHDSSAEVLPSSGTPVLPPATVDHPPLRVLAIGDSVMLGAAGALAEAIPSAEIDASVSRQVSEGIAALEARAAAGTLGDVVVIHLGTNGSFTTGQFDHVMATLQTVERVVFLNLKVPRDWEGPDNAILSESVSRYPNAVLIDWHAFASDHPEYFYDDEIHLNPEGATRYASLIAQAVQ